MLDYCYSYGVLFVLYVFFFFFNDPATTEIYTLSLHDALPISLRGTGPTAPWASGPSRSASTAHMAARTATTRSEEHTSELQSHVNLVCRLLLEKKKKIKNQDTK